MDRNGIHSLANWYCRQNNRRLAVTAVFGLVPRGPAGVDRLGGIRRDLQHRAVVIEISSVAIVAVLGHEFDNVERTFLAANVWKPDVRLKGAGLPGGVDKQAVGQDGNLRLAGNGRRNRPRPFVRGSRRWWASRDRPKCRRMDPAFADPQDCFPPATPAAPAI